MATHRELPRKLTGIMLFVGGVYRRGISGPRFICGHRRCLINWLDKSSVLVGSSGLSNCRIESLNQFLDWAISFVRLRTVAHVEVENALVKLRYSLDEFGPTRKALAGARSTVVPSRLFLRTHLTVKLRTLASSHAQVAGQHSFAEQASTKPTHLKPFHIMETNVLSAPGEAETLLGRLFAVYAAERSGGGASQLPLSKYKQLARDSGLLEAGFAPQAVELVFCSSTHHKPRMQLSTFLASLPRLAAAKWPESSAQQATIRLVNDYLLPLYVRVCGGEQALDCREADPEVRQLLRQAFPVLREMYLAYFSWEVSGAAGQVITDRSQAAYFEFLRAFDVCPQLVSKPEVFDLWRELQENKDTLRPFAAQLLPSPAEEQGRVLSLGLFLVSLYLLSAAVGPRESRREQTMELLARMEASQGFASLKTRTHTPRTESSFLVPARPASARPSQRPSTSDQHSQRLLCLFQRYAAFGNQMNSSRLGSSQFARLFRDCQLDIKPDLDVVYSQLTGRGKMDFATFQRALEIVAFRVFPDLSPEQAHAALLEQYILRLDAQLQLAPPDSYFVTRLASLLQDAEVLDVLSLSHSAVVYYYNYYSDPRGFLNYSSFMKFCRDFAIFPEMCTKPKLLALFNALAGVFSAGQDKRPGDPEGVMDENLFVEALALVAQELEVSVASSPVQRIFMLLEKLSQSNGPAKVMQGLGHGRTSAESQDLLAKLRPFYPDLLAPRVTVQPSLRELLGSKK